jgi:hypothetical protein
VLVYLDQSTLSALVTEERFAKVRDRLREAVQSGRLVCPGSVEHTGETIAAERSWEDITRLSRELSMGIDFRAEQELRQFELHAAANLFFHGKPSVALWKEAFDTDPHTPREKLFPSGFAVHAYFPPDDGRLTEIENLRQTELSLKRAYDEARAQGHSLEEQVEREFEAMRDWVLGPLVDGGHMARLLERREREVAEEWERTGKTEPGPGTPSSHYMAVAEQIGHVRRLVDRFPELRERAHEFAASEEFRSMPALRYPCIFRAAIATMAGREPKRGDGHDIAHLSRGLSRCDIVTADGGMTQLCINHKLVPAQCALLRFNDVEGLSSAIEDALAKAPPAPP